jgi:hypothetical protein
MTEKYDDQLCGYTGYTNKGRRKISHPPEWQLSYTRKHGNSAIPTEKMIPRVAPRG